MMRCSDTPWDLSLSKEGECLWTHSKDGNTWQLLERATKGSNWKKAGVERMEGKIESIEWIDRQVQDDDTPAQPWITKE